MLGNMLSVKSILNKYYDFCISFYIILSTFNIRYGIIHIILIFDIDGAYLSTLSQNGFYTYF